MKRLLALIVAASLLLVPGAGSAQEDSPPGIPGPWTKCADGDGWCMDSNRDGTVDMRADSSGNVTVSGYLGVGTPDVAADNDEIEIRSYQWTNDTAETIPGERESYVVLDNTKDTEDTVLFRYRMEAGAECVAAYFGPPVAAAPTWTPCTGCRILTDGTGADPFNAAGGLYWTGAAWAAD